MARARARPGAAAQRRQPLTRARIVDAAVALADESGAESIGMRAVARRLGVDPMSLYNHVDARTALFDGVVERLIELADLPGPGRWDVWARAAADRFMRVALEHPGAFGILGRHPVNTVDAVAHVEPFVAALIRAGFSVESCPLIVNTFFGFVASFALLSASSPLTPAPTAAEAERITEELRTRLPALSAVIDAGTEIEAEATFSAGVDLLIDGLRARLRRERRERAGAP